MPRRPPHSSSLPRASAAGTERRIDLGRVTGRPFLNNVSLGVCAQLVHRRDRHHRRHGVLARLRAWWILLTNREKLGLTVDGVNRRESRPRREQRVRPASFRDRQTGASTASRSRSSRPSSSRSSRGRYACSLRQAFNTIATKPSNASSEGGGSSGGANQRNSSTSSAARGSPGENRPRQNRFRVARPA